MFAPSSGRYATCCPEGGCERRELIADAHKSCYLDHVRRLSQDVSRIKEILLEIKVNILS